VFARTAASTPLDARQEFSATSVRRARCERHVLASQRMPVVTTARGELLHDDTVLSLPMQASHGGLPWRKRTVKAPVSAPKIPILWNPPPFLQPLIPEAEMREGAEVARTRARTGRVRLWSSRIPSASRLLISSSSPRLFAPALQSSKPGRRLAAARSRGHIARRPSVSNP
jgi:hypothetical protein